MTSVDILTEIKKRIGSSTPEVQEQLIAARVDKEVSKRVETLDKAIHKLAELKKEDIKLAKHDNVTVAGDGTQILAYSQEGYKALGKHREKMAKLDKAIDNALNDGDFNKLGEVLKKS